MPVKVLQKNPTMVEVLGCLTEEEGRYLQCNLLHDMPHDDVLIIDLRGLESMPDTITFSSIASRRRKTIFVVHQDSEIAFALTMLASLTNRTFDFVYSLAAAENLVNHQYQEG